MAWHGSWLHGQLADGAATCTLQCNSCALQLVVQGLACQYLLCGASQQQGKLAAVLSVGRSPGQAARSTKVAGSVQCWLLGAWRCNLVVLDSQVRLLHNVLSPGYCTACGNCNQPTINQGTWQKKHAAVLQHVVLLGFVCLY